MAFNFEKEVVVRNAYDTTSDPKEYGYNSWREYWEDHGHNRSELKSNRTNVNLKNGKHKFVEVYQCLACGEYFQWDGELPNNFDGCHVYIKGEGQDKQYIFPFCHSCNHSKDEFKVPSDLLVSAPQKKN